MKIRESLDTAFLCWLSQPHEERLVYRLVRKHRIHSIVELGVRDLARTQRLIRLARRCSAGACVRYTGIDLFEARPADQSRLTLKQLHQALAHSGAIVRLIPGDGPAVLSRHANQLAGTQLLLVSVGIDTGQWGRVWYYVPRMLVAPGLLLLPADAVSGRTTGYRCVGDEELRRWAQAAQQPERSAA